MTGVKHKSMVAATQNSSLSRAKTNKEDEFYTQIEDVERELKHYRKHFKGKVVYLNCDDPRVSAFFHFFSYNFEKFGLKKLIATCYRESTNRGQVSHCYMIAGISNVSATMRDPTLKHVRKQPYA